jgi:spore coat protein U-like protein
MTGTFQLLQPPRPAPARLRHSGLRGAWPFLLGAAMAVLSHQAWAVQCSISVQGVSFGSYDVFSNQSLDSTGNIGVSCDTATPYTLALSPGGGTYAAREMANGAHRLNYNLYTDATRTGVWGDGAGGTSLVSGNGTSANHTIYGRVPAAQNAYVGGYSDTVTVTINY